MLTAACDVRWCVPGVNRMTEVTISEQMTRMTRRAIAIPFQFLCGGLLPTSSCRHRGEQTWSDRKKKLWVREGLKGRSAGQEIKQGTRKRIIGRINLVKSNSEGVSQGRTWVRFTASQGDMPTAVGGGSLMSRASAAVTHKRRWQMQVDRRWSVCLTTAWQQMGTGVMTNLEGSDESRGK